MNTALTFKSVSKCFAVKADSQRYALNDVNLEVKNGRRLAIVGRSGSGKSTLLHLAAGIDLPTAGQIFVDGRELSSMSEAERTVFRRDHVGIVFQFFYLLPHLSLEENLALPDMIAGEPYAEYVDRVDALLEKVGLVDRKHDPVQQLSGGEMQRVAICRALIRRPKLLLADEPTGNLDDVTGRSVMDLMLRLVEEEQSTLIFVTHSSELAAVADEVCEIKNGRIESR
jgi:putative ABC transport system ATP-binding protein